jgi:trimeric autotransporter adhesin
VRSQVQVQASMNTNPLPTASGLVAYYKLDEGTGLSTVDAVSNANAAVLNNGTTWAVPSGVLNNIGSYLWSTTASTQSITVSTAATYKVTTTNNYGCTATATKKVTVSNPSAKITATGSLILCGGSTVTFTANSGTGFTYQWTKDGINIGGATSQVYIANSAGTYRVIVTNSYGCTKLSASKVVTECARLGEVADVTESNLSLYPNPTMDYITVSFDSEVEQASIQVINCNGAIVMEREMTAEDGAFEEVMDVTKLLPGMYVVLLHTHEGISTKRFVKQ